MKNKTKITIVAIAAAVLVCAVVIGLVCEKSKRDAVVSAQGETTEIAETAELTQGTQTTEPPQTTTEPATEQTTASATTALTKTTVKTKKTETTKKYNPKKTYNAPNQYKLIGDCTNYKIKWNDDNSLRIYKYANAGKTSKGYYDVKINDYGEATSITYTYVIESDKYETLTKVHYLHPKYNSKHQLSQMIEKDFSNIEVLYTNTYYYNNDGLRVKRVTDYYGEEHSIEYEYENGQLVKSTLYDFYPDDGGDKICNYKYDINSFGLITKSYMNIDNSCMDDGSNDIFWEESQSYTYEKVTKAQHDFFYNTLIYHIIDENESLL